MSGVGLPVGAALGLIVGLLTVGGPGIAVGMAIGASLGVVVDAIVVAHRR